MNFKNSSAVQTDGVPVLPHPVDAPTAFTPDSLIAAVRAERNLSCEPVPPVCLLEFDGDLTDWLVSTGRARPWKSWACFHTTMYTLDVDGAHCGIVARTIGGPYAVLVAEQLKVAGARVVLGLTSAGRVSGSLPVPSLVIPVQAIRDEGTSFHYVPARQSVHADARLAKVLEEELSSVGIPVRRGPVWTTDAPYRETQEQLDYYARNGVLAVEMQAASLIAFGQARELPVGVVAHVTNAVDHYENFDKGSHHVSERLVQSMCRAGMRYLQAVQDAAEGNGSSRD
jgi:uridine phosphorylase